MAILDGQGFLREFAQVLRGIKAAGPAPCRFVVAFSGGLDSSLLLAAMARSVEVSRLSAIHVDHGLHPDSADWAKHCAGIARRLSVVFQSHRVSIPKRNAYGLEAAAREARYGVLASLIESDQVLLTAHHADDQLETLLLRLIRGTGVRGLRGIHAEAGFGAGRMARPFLGFTRADLQQQAEQWGIAWLEDPSNRDVSYDRNFLRTEVLPGLKARWPGVMRTAGRLVASADDAEGILEDVAREDLARCCRSEQSAPHYESGRVPLSVDAIVTLGPARQRNLLRYGIRAAGLPVPDAKSLEALRSGLVCPGPDSQLQVQWPGGEARLYRSRLYFLAPLIDRRGAETVGHLSVDENWYGPEGTLALELVSSTDARVSGVLLPGEMARSGLEISFRVGGERFRPTGRTHHIKLKHWFQEQAIVPWMRGRIPLLYWREQLVGVADMAISADLTDDPAGGERWRVGWKSHRPIY